MSQYRPSIDELLTTVQDFLDDLSSQLAGEARYKAKVASFLLAVCAREIGAGPSHDEADRAAWADLLGTSQGDALQLKQELCAKIRRGDFDDSFDRVLDVMLARTRADARIVRPDHVDATE